MKKIAMVFIFFILVLSISSSLFSIHVRAKTNKEYIPGTSYNLGIKDDYDLTKVTVAWEKAERFYLEGDIESVSEKDGFTRFAVKNGNLKIFVDEQFGLDVFTQENKYNWHIIADKNKTVDSVKMEDKIGSGAIVVQTSRNGHSWVTVDTESDIYNKLDYINTRMNNEENIEAFYRTTDVQITSGCYYRIIVAYQLEKTIYEQLIFNDTEEKEHVEIYQFYVYNPDVENKTLDIKNAYEFGDVYKVNSEDGFDSQEKIKGEDPHADWTIGKFYVVGYTNYNKQDEIPIFFKNPDDKIQLWFNLEQELDKCNGDTNITVQDTASGSDTYFGTAKIKNIGHGMMIVRKTDSQNKKERQIYTNYLEASAAVGANTMVALYEEGDYEGALDYQLHCGDRGPFGWFNKTFTYRIPFKFKVRNGDIRMFLRSVDNDEIIDKENTGKNGFVNNGNIVKNGFSIDVCGSKYLEIIVKRKVLTDSLTGLVEDTKFNQVAHDGQRFVEEGVYTVTVRNPAADLTVEKTIYVGDQDVMLVHINTGMDLREIKGRLDAGAIIDENWQLVDPTPEPDPITEEPEEILPEENASQSVEVDESSSDAISDEIQESTNQNIDTDEVQTDNQELGEKEDASESVVVWPIIVVVSIFVVCGVLVFAWMRNNKATEKEDEGQ